MRKHIHFTTTRGESFLYFAKHSITFLCYVSQNPSVTVHKTTHRVVLFSAFDSLLIWVHQSTKAPCWVLSFPISYFPICAPPPSHNRMPSTAPARLGILFALGGFIGSKRYSIVLSSTTRYRTAAPSGAVSS